MNTAHTYTLRFVRYFSSHRKFGVFEENFIRGMKGSSYSMLDNPGIRVVPDIITPSEAESIWNESHKNIIPNFGLKGRFDDDHVLIDGVKSSSTKMNSIRVTGRHESPKQKLAPWGYADAFKKDKLPQSFQVLIEKLHKSTGFKFGECRDVTINYRTEGFFKLDPHVDPSADGEDVCIVSVGPSPTVITFTPPVHGLDYLPQTSPQALAAKRRRISAADISLLSWSDADLDVLSIPRSAVVFSGAARSIWRHATRTGVAASSAPNSIDTINCDWFGSTSQLLPRRPGSRLSIVVAFGKKS